MLIFYYDLDGIKLDVSDDVFLRFINYSTLANI